MPEIYPLAGALVAGIGLGLFYFGGLWLTVRALPSARQPALLTLGSFLARLGVTLFGFYLLMDGRWERLCAALVGFVLMRSLLVRRWRPEQPSTGKVSSARRLTSDGNNA